MHKRAGDLKAGEREAKRMPFHFKNEAQLDRTWEEQTCQRAKSPCLDRFALKQGWKSISAKNAVMITYFGSFCPLLSVTPWVKKWHVCSMCTGCSRHHWFLQPEWRSWQANDVKADIIIVIIIVIIIITQVLHRHYGGETAHYHHTQPT